MNKYRVAELRKKRGWTQEVLAEKASITVRTIQRIENGTDVSLDTLASISNALLVPVSELFERIEEEAKEVEIMDMSKEQLIQLKYRRTIIVSITLLVIAAILLVMSILGVQINELASGYNITLSWLAWVSLLLLLIGLANYYLGVKLNETLDQKYPLTKGIKLKEKKERFENLWQFFSIYWWMIFPIFGFITWFISFFNSL
ncbi:helix-turn-helix domain-containing protein [Lactococcus lactis subsp. lactis]|uniref:helix-turn-helix domain-containing protein n=1 Tax=Lactococcus lactis TaxID=1358 RepID=UPI001BA94DEE|nr:helix-turn-helix domain-containing protein [Lactococcus lactis]MBR8680549.1 helix-turn-helix domain-containing protein [Lactococcus lactis subsp. lactis]MBR8682912.1 helix-turn-helix domain-containing protein [Lactococcus lactis subsp. lactis]MBR8688044.1 helix-turn-helix domain-containing protein [Lactococcus lactis subsp. lactis]MBS3731246.1 helix-turn-helix domain-containing protein [Lactococcus lactis subsp. lactis]